MRRPGSCGKKAVREMSDLKVVSKGLPKVDSEAIVRGEPHYVMDMVPDGALHAVILRSPHAHARIKRIDAARAESLPGVVMVLTHDDVPRVPFTTAGQNYPEPSPYDTFMLDDKVRFVGDRVAVVVAENRQVALRRLRLNLALEVRCPCEAGDGPSPLWQSRCRGRRIDVSASHDDFPAVLAEALDWIAACESDVKGAAETTACSTSQLLKLLKKEPRALALVNRWREERGLSRLR